MKTEQGERGPRFGQRPLAVSRRRLRNVAHVLLHVTCDGGLFWIVSWRFESSPELLGGGRSAAGEGLDSEVDGRGFGWRGRGLTLSEV